MSTTLTRHIKNLNSAITAKNKEIRKLKWEVKIQKDKVKFYKEQEDIWFNHFNNALKTLDEERDKDNSKKLLIANEIIDIFLAAERISSGSEYKGFDIEEINIPKDNVKIFGYHISEEQQEYLKERMKHYHYHWNVSKLITSKSSLVWAEEEYGLKKEHEKKINRTSKS